VRAAQHDLSCSSDSRKTCASSALTRSVIEVPSPCEAASAANQSEVASAMPKHQAAEANSIAHEEKTTILVRNVPCQYKQDQLLEELLQAGWKINFLYLPIRKSMKGNAGFVFINFETHEEAEAFLEKHQGYKFERNPNSKKRAVCDWAKMQGYEANIQFYSQTDVPFWTPEKSM